MLAATNGAAANVKPTENKQEEQLTAVKFSPKPRPGVIKKKVKDDFVGSRDLSVRPPSQPIKLPLGVNPSQTVETSPNADNSNSVSDEQILPFLGIEVVKEDGNLKIKTVKENSLAAHSGVKIGDVIEEINGVKLSARPLRTKQAEVKNLTIVRGTDKIKITLKN